MSDFVQIRLKDAENGLFSFRSDFATHLHFVLECLSNQETQAFLACFIYIYWFYFLYLFMQHTLYLIYPEAFNNPILKCWCMISWLRWARVFVFLINTFLSSRPQILPFFKLGKREIFKENLWSSSLNTKYRFIHGIRDLASYRMDSVSICNTLSWAHEGWW